MTMFNFGCGHVKYDENIHDAKWGARLIYDEVVRGGGGVVWDRQTPSGEAELVESLFPLVNTALAQFRLQQYELPGNSRGHLCYREGQRLVVMSPQQSYGYLYITAVLEKPNHLGETEVWDMSDQKDDYGHPVPELGNWPTRVVEAREAAELDRKAKRLKAIRDWDLPHAERELRWAAGKRTEKSKQRALDAVRVEIEDLEFDLGLDEITREGAAMAAGGLI
jgi:hypothetical protein